VPVYLGCDWQNVPLHLPHTFTAYERLTNSKHLQVAMMGEHGLSWPWESLYIEAIAWFDHWLKGQDTGILEGPSFRCVLPEADGWRTSNAWPIHEASHHAYTLRADAVLGKDEGEAGSRTYMNLGSGLNRPRASEADPPAFLYWTTPPLPHDLDLTGPIERQLDAACTAPDTAFIAVLQDMDENGKAINVTSGYLRAGLRAVDEAASKLGAPVLTCRAFKAVPIGKIVNYRIPLVQNARRFRSGHRLRLYLTTDDQNADRPTLLEFRHASIGTSSFNAVFSSSRLHLPVVR
jgi:predicted acyl esterase